MLMPSPPSEGKRENYHEKQSRRVGLVPRVNIQFDHIIANVLSFFQGSAQLEMTDKLDY